jgi:putative ABC transport system ATP-binding protein
VVISIENLKVEYRNGGEPLPVLDIPSWRVEKSEQVAISGPSGCGKSTLLHVLAGLLVPTSGAVRICAQDLVRMGEAERDRFRAQHVGVIFQNFNLLQGYTALENVLLGMTFSPHAPQRSHAKDLLDELGLSQRLKHYPSQMSLGEQQRVAIARALVKRPELILADEPTGSLDPRHAMGVVEKLREACRTHGCSLVVVSHQSEVVAAFEKRVAFMELNRAFSAQRGVA